MSAQTIEFDEAVCRNLDLASVREWLETNGIGGYASSTVAGINTRRYHGLLVAATKPPAGRVVMLSKLEETLVIGEARYELSANRYPGCVYPQGCLYLKRFRLDPFPTLLYEVGGVEIEKAVFMLQGENTTVIRYSLRGAAEGCTLEIRPLIAFRDYHATTHENGALNANVEVEDGNLKLTPYQGLPSMYLAHSGGEVQKTGEWYRNFEYDRERERGLDFQEDLFNPLTMVFQLGHEGRVDLIASTEPHPIECAAMRYESETKRRADGSDSLLARAAKQFVVRRGQWKSILAGYHWFTDWGRDAMISLPGLLLSTGQYDDARSVLQAFAGCVNEGMLPNRFPDCGETPEYNTADATLWFFEAARAYVASTNDFGFVQQNLDSVMRDVIAHHEQGTRYGIRVESDGLLHCGEPGTQLTWMDAKIGDWVVTPRQGKPVEIQALWYNALCVIQDFAARAQDAEGSAKYGKMAEHARQSFSELFWNEEAGCLYDVIDGERRDGSIRPNQIFALSLFHTMVMPDRASRVLDAVQRHLLTPYGLRTLSPQDPNYRGRFEGDPRSRDSAYHQGTVWPWLMGPFVSAHFKVRGRIPETLAQAARWLGPLEWFLQDEGVGQLPEVFDGDAPQRPGGCIAQAWSIAELLRVGAA